MCSLTPIRKPQGAPEGSKGAQGFQKGHNHIRGTYCCLPHPENAHAKGIDSGKNDLQGQGREAIMDISMYTV